MGDDDGGEAELAAGVGDEGEDGVAPHRVEAGGGLVEEHQLGAGDEGAGEGEAFLHPAGELGRVAPGVALELEAPERVGHALADLGLGQEGGLLERERDVFPGGERVEQGVALEKVGAAGAKGGEGGGVAAGERRAVEADLAGVGREHAREALEEHGLAGAGLAHDGEHAAARHGEIDVGEHDAVAEAFFQAAGREQGGGRRGRCIRKTHTKSEVTR